MKMKSSLSGVLLVLLLGGACVSGLGSVVQRYYNYIHSHVTWHYAQNYCKSSTYYVDLATIFGQSDEDKITMTQYHAWIGLYKLTEDLNWAWSDGQSYSYSEARWQESQPHSNSDCATVYYPYQRTYGQGCGAYFFFFCHDKKKKHNDYKFIPKSKTWSEAQQYCREHSDYDDLASFRDYENAPKIVVEQNFPVWTGLHRDGGTFRWSTMESDYTNWANGEPRGDGDCVSIYSTSKELATQDCSARLPYVCFRHNVILVKENKTWEEALEHCRALGRDLLSVQPEEDHDFVMVMVMQAETDEMWTGLRFLGDQWLWVNRAPLSHTDLPPCPPERQRCGVLNKNSTGSVETLDCTERRNFLCYT
ncbi:macrophage mannose receptor 1-like [Centropristis striata]|uniref:macrophage mannose receptor 1-like n=1 Tax=Centropristis striata TaxID=184440 RepID=UPI0027DEF319|nr:macrophage mannose receptor 1-like [Centropristis striata]